MLVNFDLHFHVKRALSSEGVFRLAIQLNSLTVDAWTRIALPASSDEEPSCV